MAKHGSTHALTQAREKAVNSSQNNDQTVTKIVMSILSIRSHTELIMSILSIGSHTELI